METKLAVSSRTSHFKCFVIPLMPAGIQIYHGSNVLDRIRCKSNVEIDVSLGS